MTLKHVDDITPARAAPPRHPVLSHEQQEAARQIEAFLDSNRRIFSLHGLAGTGKSTLLACIAKTPLNPLVCAPTGPAAASLGEKFGVRARTIHGLFYNLRSEARGTKRRRDLEFSPPCLDGSLAGRVLLIDESSMVTAELRDQLLATGVRIVAFGDPGQLPPMQGEPGFLQADFTLSQIHRQAASSSIIRQAHRVRSGDDYQPDGDEFQVVTKGSHELLRQVQVVLVYRNETRRRLNQLARRVIMNGEIPGRPAADGSFNPDTEYPRAGEHVVVLRNGPQCPSSGFLRQRAG